MGFHSGGWDARGASLKDDDPSQATRVIHMLVVMEVRRHVLHRPPPALLSINHRQGTVEAPTSPQRNATTESLKDSCQKPAWISRSLLSTKCVGQRPALYPGAGEERRMTDNRRNAAQVSVLPLPALLGFLLLARLPVPLIPPPGRILGPRAFY